MQARWIIIALLGLAGCERSAADPAQRSAKPQRAGAVARPERTRTGFVPPALAERTRAAGPMADFALRDLRAFRPSPLFTPLDRPDPGDWLAEHHEPGQTYQHYTRSRANRPGNTRRTIYLLPLLGAPRGLPSIELLARYVGIYFALPVRILPPLRRIEAATRLHPKTRRYQLLTTDILERLPRHLPGDAYALLALTEHDLYAGPRSAFVFGQASYRERVGVISFARLRPSFHRLELPRAVEAEIVLARALKLLGHEIGHMFGLHHCIYYRCALNGANSLRELDSAPLHSCPVCLRKLHHAVGFDPIRRYRKLARFYQRHGLQKDQRWVMRRVSELRDPNR